MEEPFEIISNTNGPALTKAKAKGNNNIAPRFFFANKIAQINEGIEAIKDKINTIGFSSGFKWLSVELKSSATGKVAETTANGDISIAKQTTFIIPGIEPKFFIIFFIDLEPTTHFNNCTSPY